MTGKYFYSKSERAFTMILDRGVDHQGARYGTIRVRNKSCMIYDAESERSAMLLLPANSNSCAPGPFKEALAAFMAQGEVVIRMEATNKTIEQAAMERTLRFIHSQHLERLRAEYLEVEDYANAIYVRNEIDRRVEAGFMERQSDGLALPKEGQDWIPSQG
jgi:hypothetical protein